MARCKAIRRRALPLRKPGTGAIVMTRKEKIKMKYRFIGMLAVAGLLCAPLASAAEIDPASLPEGKRFTANNYLSATDASAMKRSGGPAVLLIDVRTQAEVEYVGIADTVDANIPYMLDDYGQWDDRKARFLSEPNSDFLIRIDEMIGKRGLDKQATVILMCRSGDRSARAADLMLKAGYTRVYSVIDGFEGDLAKEGGNRGKRLVNGWKNADLPWSYQLNKDKMYID